MGFSRQEYCRGLLYPPPGDLPNLGTAALSLPSHLLHWQAGSLPLVPPGKPRGSGRDKVNMDSPLPHTHRVRCFFLSRSAQCPKSSRWDRTKWSRSASKGGVLAKIWAFSTNYKLKQGFSGGSDSKESVWNARDLIFPGLGRSPGGGLGNPLQYLAWRIPRTEEPGGLQSMGSQRVRHDWATKHRR